MSRLGWWHYGRKYRERVHAHIVQIGLMCALPLPSCTTSSFPYSLSHMQARSFFIDSMPKKCSCSKCSEWSQSPVACLLVSSAEAAEGSPVHVAGGRTGFKCVLSSGGSCGRAREQSGPPSASHCCCLRRKLLIQGIAKSYDHNVGLQHKLPSQQESQICDRDRAKAVNFTISEMNESLSRLSLASGHFLSSVSTIVAWPVEHQTSTWTKLVA